MILQYWKIFIPPYKSFDKNEAVQEVRRLNKYFRNETNVRNCFSLNKKSDLVFASNMKPEEGVLVDISKENKII